MDASFEIVLALVLLIFGILQIILFFKVWGMTNNVKDILRTLNGSGGIESLDLEDLTSYCEKQLSIAKKKKALQDDSYFNVLKGLIYDIESIDGKISSYGMNELQKYIDEAKELLNQE